MSNSISLIKKIAIWLSLSLIAGCGLSDAALLNPSGPIALAERDLLIQVTLLMLVVAIPVFAMAIWYPWRFRQHGTGRFRPEWPGSVWVEFAIWGVPAILVAVIGAMVWTSTHRLDPGRELAGDVLDIQVISYDHSYLFIYPDQDIAMTNQMVFPQSRPVRLSMAADGPMTALFIPDLGSQIYAMAGMMTELNLSAFETGTFQGRNALYNGDDFVTQTFDVDVLDDEAFDVWVAQAQQAAPLTPDVYDMLDHTVRLFSDVPEDFFNILVRETTTPHKAQQTPRYP